MSYKKLWIYLIVLIGVTGFWITVAYIFPKKPEEVKTPLLFNNLEATQIQAIKFEKGGQVIYLQKARSWAITQPISAPADDQVLADVLQTVTQLRPERRIAEAHNGMKAFGLEPPGVKISFLCQGRWSEMQVGNQTAIGTAYYVKTSDSPDLFLVEDYQIKALNRDLFNLRDKKVFPFYPDQVNGLELRSAKKAFFLERDSRGWHLKDRREVTINGDKVNSFIADLLWMRVIGFTGSSVENLQWGLKTPRYQIVVRSTAENGREEVLKLGQEVPGKGLCAWSSLQREVVFLDPTFLKKIPQGPEDWEDKSPTAPPKKGPDG